MALRTTAPEYTLEIWKLNCDALATDVGDLALLTANVSTSVVASLNDIQDQIDAIVVGAFTLSNNVWFVGNGNPSGTVNVFRVNTLNKIEFGAQVASIDIIGGTITSLTSAIPTSVGGTGSGVLSTARSNLGLAIGTNVQAWSARLDDISALAVTSGNVIIANGTNWVANTPTAFKTAMGLTVGTHVQAWSARLDSISAIVPNSDTFLVGNGTIWTNRDASAMRSILGLVVGVDVQEYSSHLSSIVAGNKTLNNFLMADGTTYQSVTPTQVRTALALTVGTNVQAYHTNLQNISAIGTPTDMYILSSNSGVIQAKSPLSIRTDLGLKLPADGSPTVQPYSLLLDNISVASPALNNFLIGNGSSFISNTASQARTAMGVAIGSNVQAWNTKLDAISALTPNVDNFLVGNGSTWVLTSGASARTSLGVAIGTNVQAWSARLDNIASFTAPSNGGVMVGNGSGWVLWSGSALRTVLGCAGSGANFDITSISNLGFDLEFNASTITMSPGGAVDCWRFDSSGHLITLGGIVRDIGTAGGNYPRNIYAQSFLPVGRPTDYNLSAFGYTRRVSLNASSATTQQVAEFALSIADDLQAIGIFGGV